MSRAFTIEKATRTAVPLFLGLWGPSNGGKTFSALRLATGIQRVFPGEIVMLDTENGRGNHYADRFKYNHVDFQPPFGSSDYLAAIQQIEEYNPSVLIIDSFTHEHTGENGYLDAQAKKAEELAKKWRTTPDKATMPAWAYVSGLRKKLISHIMRTNVNVIVCFRAKDKNAPAKNEKGKMEIVHYGYVPDAGKDFIYEMTASMLLQPHSDGRATFSTGMKGEDMMTKLPIQFRDIFPEESLQLSEDIGEKLGIWARGDAKPAPQAVPSQGGLDIQVEEEAPDHITAINTLKDYLDNNLIPLESVEETQHMVAWLQRKGAQSRNEKNWTAIMEHIRNLETSIADPDRVKHGLPVY